MPSSDTMIDNIPKGTRMTIDNEELGKLQRRVALLTVIVPFLGAVTAIGLLWYTGTISWVEISLLVVMYIITVLGITVGYHRQFAHRSFQASPAVRTMLAIMGSMAAEGPVIHWVSNHRRHHSYSDRPGDPHSPHLHGDSVWGQLRGLWHAHVGWLFSKEVTNSLLFSKDLIRDRPLLKINRLYWWWVLLGIVVPGVLGGLLTWSWLGIINGMLWGGLVRIFFVHHATWSVNSITHMYGTRPFETNDHSTNNGLLAILTGGEAWHNNHHAFPNSAMLGLTRRQIDFGGWFIRAFERAGWIWDVNVPSETKIAEKKLTMNNEQ